MGRFPPTKEEMNMSHEERGIRHKIAYEKSRFNSFETGARHKMVMGVWDSKKYRAAVNKAEDGMESEVKRLREELGGKG